MPTPVGTQYRTEELFETAGENNEKISLPDAERQEAKEPSGEQEKKEYLEQQENYAYVAYDAANRYRYGDPEENLKSLFCLDPDTGVAYFVNQNKDWCIYRLVNGRTELAVGLPARELYVVNGTVYFILEDYDQYELEEGLTEGDIYACTLADGSVKKVFSAEGLGSEIYRMRPYEDGIAIYCRVDTGDSENQKIREVYLFYRFANAVLEEDSCKRVLPGWKDYYLTRKKKDSTRFFSLWSRSNHEAEQINFDGIGGRGFIVKDVLYFFGRTRCVTIDLLTGKQTEYDVYSIFKELAPERVAAMERIHEENGLTGYTWLVEGFTVTRDYVWMSLLNTYVLRLNPVSGEAACYMLESQFGQTGWVRELYTDGINLYATYISSRTPEDFERRTPVRICTEKIVGQDKLTVLPLLAVEHLTK